MAEDTLHVIPHNEEWAVKREGNERVTSTHSDQGEAISNAKSLARDGDKIVVHSSDGTIREKFTFSDSNPTSENGRSTMSNEIQSKNVVSVGTRVSWGAIFAGAFVGMAVYFALTFLALAIGVTTIDHLHHKTFTISATVVSVFTCLVSLFVGGFVVSRTTVGENKAEALIYGLILWGVLFVIPIALTGASFGVGYGAFALNTDQPASQMLSVKKMSYGLELTDKQKQQYQQMVKESQNLIDEVSISTLGWIGFGTMALSILAAVAGAVVGAGPELVFKQIRDRRFQVEQAA